MRRFRHNLNTRVQIKLTEHVWLAGKGRGVCKYDWSKAGNWRVGINEAAYYVPKCKIAFAKDPLVLLCYKRRLPKNIIVMTKWGGDRPFFQRMYWWQKGVEGPGGNISAVPAVQVLRYLGAKYIHMVGFNSVHGDTGYPHQFTLPRPDVYGRGIEELKAIEGIELIWEDKNGNS